MNNTEIIKLVHQNIVKAQEEKIDYEVFYSEELREGYQHEFIFFIKPEITLRDEGNPSGIKISEILQMMLDRFSAFNVKIKDIRILSARYLDRFNIIADHYGVINALCSHAKETMSEQAVHEFETQYNKKAENERVLGGFEFLEEFDSFSPSTLDMLWQKSQAVKLAPGTYCAEININKEKIYLINGFHPSQIAHFTRRGRSIVVFTLAGNLDWKTARNDFIGKTNPVQAAKGSLRHELFMDMNQYGLSTVSSSWNGFHLSAGPLEGLVELIRYDSNYLTGSLKSADDFVFGRMLLTHFSPDQVERLLQNPVFLYHDEKISAFDLTEEKNNDEALQLLLSVKTNNPVS